MGASQLHSRRRFLMGNRQTEPVVRPPWTPSETEFIDQCRRCNDCVTACETGLLKKGSGGYPEADFSQSGCLFCDACNDACTHNVIQKSDLPAWHLKAAISDQCLAKNGVHCRTCQESCEPQAIHFKLQPGGIALPTLDTERCTGCGECIAPCPINTITMTSYIPRKNTLMEQTL
ncbi:ferredoxin-type protein NapF [Endozoicomonas ascidiicola]|uniref:ferredoxin-type protein NapF n=1 Tax=Endozoicomonas ascidiicola TaxID=1698521 RepID=UPI00082CAEFD|nr:ferredoxin-type protein NapF [Endozoicomonas ascidiicola]